MNIIDTHAHLDMSDFENELDDVINRAQSLGINKIVTIGIDLDSSRKAVKLAEQYPGVLASVGIHPQESKDIQKDDILQLVAISNHPRVVGIGETGLDFYHDSTSPEDQFKAFEWQLEIAKSAGLPAIIHSRKALEDTQRVLRSWCASFELPAGKSRGVIHCFSGNLKTALDYIEMGFYISLGGYIGYPSSSSFRTIIKEIPQDRLVIETDCPFLPPQKYRGKRNEPAYAKITLDLLAELKQVSVEEMAFQTTQNAEKLFNLQRFNLV